MIRLPGLDPKLAQAIDRAIREAARLPEYADAAALPPAADHARELAYVTDITMVAVSDGTDWRRLDTGATL